MARRFAGKRGGEIAWRDLPVVVVGLGSSGRAAARRLVGLGANITAVDDKPAAQFGEALVDLQAMGCVLRLGGADPSALRGAGLVIVSPGVPPSHPVIAAALGAGIDVWSEVELACRFIACPMLAVTGTNGKTTTTHLLAAMCQAGGRRTLAGGNIGTPLVEVAFSAGSPELVVAEISSFQLEFVEDFWAAAGVLLNVADDHLDWHGSFSAYEQTKARVWQRQTSADAAVFNAEDPVATKLGERASGWPTPFRTTEPNAGEVGVAEGFVVSRLTGRAQRIWEIGTLRPAGRHNLSNAIAATACALHAGIPSAAIASAVAAFESQPHRVEPVAEVDGVLFVNDSKGTNPHAALAAIEGFPRVIWIAGGRNKGLSFDDLVGRSAERIAGAVVIGEAAPDLVRALAAAGVAPVDAASSMGEAVRRAFAMARPGDTVLLSPACASQDMFEDYRERGRVFRAAVESLVVAVASRSSVGESSGTGMS
ncbi:MAG: UDP-N-acetylmuramoyl-L-alanine--D-glutamate ligase [Actinomycetota bacterium]